MTRTDESVIDAIIALELAHEDLRDMRRQVERGVIEMERQMHRNMRAYWARQQIGRK